VKMKPEAHDYPRRRLARLKEELRLLQKKREHVKTDSSLDAERAVEIRYYDAITRWILEGVERLEAALRCADGSPSPRT